MFKIGVDCEDVARFSRLSYAESGNFYKRIFTPSEISYCVSYRKPYQRFAARFAAKEAVIKALKGIAKMYYRDIEILKEKNGEPRIRVNPKKIGKIKGLSIFLSLTHSRTRAVAFVIATDMKNEKNKFKKALIACKKEYADNQL